MGQPSDRMGLGWSWNRRVWLGTYISIARHRTTVNPYKAAAVLVTTGPFRISRNPIYVSDWLVYAGVMLLLHNLVAHLPGTAGLGFNALCRNPA